MVWGLVQGVGAEIVFLFFFYKKWDLKILILASIVSAIFSYSLDFYIYEYRNLSLSFNLIQLISFVISSAFLAGYLSNNVSERLVRLGLLDQFLIASKQDLKNV